MEKVKHSNEIKSNITEDWKGDIVVILLDDQRYVNSSDISYNLKCPIKSQFKSCIQVYTTNAFKNFVG